MKIFLLLIIITNLLMSITYGQNSATITEQYAGVVYTHSLSVDELKTTKSISPRLGLNVRFGGPIGTFCTRVIYDLPDQPFGHIYWEVPIQEYGWDGIRILTGYQPRLASLIKPGPLTIDGHNQTFAAASAPNSTYALRLMINDSVSVNSKIRILAGAYMDQENNIGFECATQLYFDSTKVGLSSFIDHFVIGASFFVDAEIGNGFFIIRSNKYLCLQDVAGSFQINETFIGDPYIDIVWNKEVIKIVTAEVGTFTDFNLPNEYNAQLGVAYDFAEKITKVYITFYL